MIKTIKDLRNAPDQELLEMVKKAPGNTGKSFQSTFGVEFSYTTLTKELNNRGYKKEWHKVDGGKGKKGIVAKIYNLNNLEDRTRRNLTIPDEIFKIYIKYFGKIHNQSVVIGVALERFIEDYKNGLIDFKEL